MDKNTTDYGPFPPYNNFDMNSKEHYYQDPMLNPMLQYEQAFMYYRYLTSQMEYKIRCKEYEKMCKSDSKSDRRVVE